MTIREWAATQKIYKTSNEFNVYVDSQPRCSAVIYTDWFHLLGTFGEAELIDVPSLNVYKMENGRNFREYEMLVA